MKNKTWLLAILFLVLCFSFAEAAGTITLRLMAVNPSDSEQTVPIKVYLPLEVKPENVIYKGDLEVAYDAQQGGYYVFGEYQLKPKEQLEKEIEIQDVWVIDQAQIAILRQDAKEILTAFEKTDYYDRALLLYNGIDKKLKEVEQMQDLSSASPSYKISNYRNSVSLLSSTKEDLLSAKTLLSEVAPKGLARFTWKIFLFIIVFLGVLGGGFFVIWQRQTKLEEEQKPQQE